MNPWEDLSKSHGGELVDWLTVATVLTCVAGVLLILFGLRRCQRVGLDATAKWILLLALGMLPVFASILGAGAVMETAKEPERCMTCHVMEPYGKDMHDPKSDKLAALHFRNRWIRQNQCYECHSHYGVFGTFEAKMDGVGHLYHYLTHTYEEPIRMKRPYPIDQCLKCHGPSDAFQKIKKHSDPKVVEDLKAGRISCLECHESPHPRPEKKE
jgi:nitrate/TMAO reductase-like tetraheme cytochrome c subunit